MSMFRDGRDRFMTVKTEILTLHGQTRDFTHVIAIKTPV